MTGRAAPKLRMLKRAMKSSMTAENLVEIAMLAVLMLEVVDEWEWMSGKWKWCKCWKTRRMWIGGTDYVGTWSERRAHCRGRRVGRAARWEGTNT